MASRNIANMHLFLEMKTKFPYLPEDTLRNYVFLYAQDQAKCLNLLQKENENHFHLSHQFSDFRPTENKTSFKTNENIKRNVDSRSDPSNLNIPLKENENILPYNSNTKTNHFHQKVGTNSTFSNTNASVLYLSTKSTLLNTHPKPECHSAPILEESERPFISMFQSVPDSSHDIKKLLYRDQNDNHRMMFSTTKEHIIEPLEVSSDYESSQTVSSSNQTDSSKRHAVKLSITPALPFQQQQMNLYSNSVCATASHSSKPGRHTTSLNFQLQPQFSDHTPLEISTTPTGVENPSNYRDFGSHVQISVGSQGTTFTALRLQRPSTVLNHNIDISPSHLFSDEVHVKNSELSSQVLNSKIGVFPTSFQDKPNSLFKSHNIETNDGQTYPSSSIISNVDLVNEHRLFERSDFLLKQNQSKLNNPNSVYTCNQVASNYIQAVKKRQLSQLNIIQEELYKTQSIYSNLKSEVTKLESELQKKRKNKNFSKSEEIKTLQEENRQLRYECNCLLLEYDMCSKGQIPVGVTDEDFYSNIFTGPNNCFALNSQNVSVKNNSAIDTSPTPSQGKDDEEDEKNSWRCKKCTFVNHPALEKCEICEIAKNSGAFFDDS